MLLTLLEPSRSAKERIEQALSFVFIGAFRKAGTVRETISQHIQVARMICLHASHPFETRLKLVVRFSSGASEALGEKHELMWVLRKH